MVFMSPRGGPSRCYNFLQDFLKCVQDEAPRDDPSACKPYAEDYLECLHHRKYYLRELQIQEEEKRQAAVAAAPPKAPH